MSLTAHQMYFLILYEYFVIVMKNTKDFLHISSSVQSACYSSIDYQHPSYKAKPDVGIQDDQKRYFSHNYRVISKPPHSCMYTVQYIK